MRTAEWFALWFHFSKTCDFKCYKCEQFKGEWERILSAPLYNSTLIEPFCFHLLTCDWIKNWVFHFQDQYRYMYAILIVMHLNNFRVNVKGLYLLPLFNSTYNHLALTRDVHFWCALSSNRLCFFVYFQDICYLSSFVKNNVTNQFHSWNSTMR